MINGEVLLENARAEAYYQWLSVSDHTGIVTLQLSESDYNVESSESVFSGLVVSDGTISDSPIQIQLLPLTFEQYNGLFPNSDGSCTIPNGANPAESKCTIPANFMAPIIFQCVQARTLVRL